MMRIKQHPILDLRSEAEAEVDISVDGKLIRAKKGEPILAALLANGIRITRYTSHFGEPRGLYCGIGRCTDCIMEVNGAPNVRTCVTPVEEGMSVITPNSCGENDKNA